MDYIHKQVHSLQTVRSRTVACVKPGGLHSSKTKPQIACQQKTLPSNKRKMGRREQDITYAIPFPFSPAGIQPMASRNLEQTCLKFMEVELVKALMQKNHAMVIFGS